MTLLSELRRSPVAGDRQVAEMLHSLRPATGSSPRASEALAAFIAERGAGLAPREGLQAPAGSPSLLVVLGDGSDPKPARRRVLTGVWGHVTAAAAVALVAVAAAVSGPSRDVVVRPTDSSSTVVPAATTPADKADPTPQRHHPVAPGVGSRPHRARTHPAATPTTSSGRPDAVRPSATAPVDEASASESEVTAGREDSGDDRGDVSQSGTDDGGAEPSGDGAAPDGGEPSDGGGADTGETPATD